jgi:Cu/Ag efflux protein CusF
MRGALRYGIIILTLSGCQQPSQPPASQPPAAAPAAQSQPPKEYPLVGEIVRVDRDAKRATIKHEKIEGYMAAMTMAYPIPEQADLDKIKEGDRITATVYDSEGDSRYWVGNIEVQVGEPAAK